MQNKLSRDIRISKDSIPTEFASCVKNWCVLVDFTCEMTVSADTNITSLDVAGVTGLLQNWPYTRAVNQGGGLYRVWFNVDGAEYAICNSRDPFTLAFCLLLASLYLAASLAIQLAEGGPGAGLPLNNLDLSLGGGRWGRRRWRNLYWSSTSSSCQGSLMCCCTSLCLPSCSSASLSLTRCWVQSC